MKTIHVIAALAALGAITIAAPRASALSCYAPATSFFDDTIFASSGNGAQVDCDARNNAGTQKTAQGTAVANPNTRRLTVNLVAGTFARAGTYDSAGLGTGCFVTDGAVGGSGTSVTCPTNFMYFDMEVDN